MEVKKDEIHQESETHSITNGLRPAFVYGHTSYHVLIQHFVSVSEMLIFGSIDSVMGL